VIKKYCLFVFAFLLISSCSYLGDDIEIASNTKSLAVPIAYGNLSLDDVIDRAQGDAKLRIDGQGRVTALYSGEILRENSTKIFPPVPGIFEFPIFDTSVELPLPVNAAYRVDRGTFEQTNIFFRVKHDKPEIVKLIMTIPSLTKDNVTWKKEYALDFTNTTEVNTVTSNLDKWVALPNANKIKFEYEAIRPNGEKIKLNSIVMKFDLLKFSYMEGYFGNHTFDVKGDVIKINIFDQWKSGGIEFEDPIIQLDVDNGFGFPVRSKVNQMVLKTVTGEIFNVESDYINKGIDFAYPTIDQLGQLKNTKFQFNSSNSNVGQLFRDKVVQVIYDFDAVANPDNDQSIKNFFNSDAYFSIKIDVELPMKVKSNTFTIQDTVDINFSDFDEVASASLKIKTANNFPMDMLLTAVFLDVNGSVVESLSPNESILIKAATLGSDGKTNNKTSNEANIKMDASRFTKIRDAKKMLVTASFDTNAASAKPIWFYNNYGIDLEIGAIVNVKL
jgi:hypothetical protein